MSAVFKNIPNLGIKDKSLLNFRIGDNCHKTLPVLKPVHDDSCVHGFRAEPGILNEGLTEADKLPLPFVNISAWRNR